MWMNAAREAPLNRRGSPFPMGFHSKQWRTIQVRAVPKLDLDTGCRCWQFIGGDSRASTEGVRGETWKGDSQSEVSSLWTIPAQPHWGLSDRWCTTHCRSAPWKGRGWGGSPQLPIYRWLMDAPGATSPMALWSCPEGTDSSGRQIQETFCAVGAWPWRPV